MADSHHTPESRSSQNNCLTILSHPVRRRGDFYSLNDLHQAAGGDPGLHPERYLETPLARAWEASLDGRARSALLQGDDGVGGAREGSVSVFARRELAQGYALWVGEGFALAVLRAFGAQAPGAELDPLPHTRYELGYVRDLRWEEDRAEDIAWWEYDGQGDLTAEEAVERGRAFFEQTRRLARVNPKDAEMALKRSLMRWFEGDFPGAGFHYCELVFCELVCGVAVEGMVRSNGSGGG